MYRSHILDTYGRASGGHGSHGGHGGGAKMFQAVPSDKATILQSGRSKKSCTTCGMKLANSFKANHAAKQDGEIKQFCSLHCFSKEIGIKKTPLTDFQVVDVKSLKFIDAKKAFYVLGSKKRGVMSKTSKFAFALEAEALAFITKYGGKIVGFNEAYKNALKDYKRRPAKSFKEPTASDAIYFSDTNPVAKKKKSYGGHNHGGGRNYVPSKKVWPTFEDNSGKKNCLGNIDAQLYVLDANLKTKKLTQSKDGGCKSVTFKMPDNGYYNLFYVDKAIQDNTLYIKTAKYEKMRFNHSNDAVYDEKKMDAHSIKEIPFDILRVREDGETFYHRLYSGEKIRLMVMLNSKAIQNAKLTLSTKTGWSKTVKTDKDGIAVFTLVKDYFPEWNKFDRRHKNNFLLTANYTQETDGIYDDKEYSSINYEATYSSLYYPGESGYSSYAYGLFAATATAILSGFVIYWYRKRRERPFKEVRFDEKD